MPLLSISEAPRVTSGDVSFLMLDGDKTVRVDVTGALLTHLEGFSPHSQAAYVSWFENYRDRIEQIASAKYDDGDYQQYGNGCVVPVRLADWTLDKSG
jgi:uncharacterized protein DUF1488